MTESTEKKQNNQSSSGFFLIVLGIIGIATRFIGGTNWNTIGIFKLGISILVLTFGLWTVLKKKTK